MSKYKVAEDLAMSETGFLFLPGTGETFTSNEIGRKIIQLIQKGESSDKIIEKITNEYDIDSNTFEKDLNDFLIQLSQYNVAQELWNEREKTIFKQ